jgi:hypothetical protein
VSIVHTQWTYENKNNNKVFLQYPSVKVEFQSCQDYKDYMNGVFKYFPEKLPMFFCDKKMFGQTINNCTWDCYNDYWAVAQSELFAWLLDRNFTSTWKNLNQFKKQFNNPNVHSKNKAPWRGVGMLNLYMLIANMCVANLVDFPTVNEVAGIVYELCMGALSGLVAAGYCVPRCSYLAIHSGFVDFYTDLTSAMLADQKTRFNWSPVVAEHLLCKLVCLLNLKLYAL